MNNSPNVYEIMRYVVLARGIDVPDPILRDEAWRIKCEGVSSNLDPSEWLRAIENGIFDMEDTYGFCHDKWSFWLGRNW